MMPRKKDPSSNSAQKVIGLFGLLLFSGRAHSLAQLSHAFHCSKQTVLRMIEEIERSGWLALDTWTDSLRRKWYQARTPKKLPNATLDADALTQLLLCRDMVWHMLPEGYRSGTSRTLQRATVLLPEFDDRAEALPDYVRTKPKGMIDYSGKEKMITALTQAIRTRRLCTIAYRGPTHARAETYTVAPYQLIIFHEGLYIRCRPEAALDRKCGTGPSEARHERRRACPQHSPDKTLAIHRMKEVEVLREGFEPIAEETTRGHAGPFGLTWGKPFTVKVRIVPKAAMYVRERIWSDDQAIENLDDGGLLLTFTSTSELETLSWVLSFGGEAELLEPEGLRRKVAARASGILAEHL